MYSSNMSDNGELDHSGSRQRIELEDVEAELLALRKLYTLLQTNGTSNNLDDRALSLLKSLLDAAAEKLLETHTKILAAKLYSNTKPEGHHNTHLYIPETQSTTPRTHNPNRHSPTISTNHQGLSHIPTGGDSSPTTHQNPSIYHQKPPRPKAPDTRLELAYQNQPCRNHQVITSNQPEKKLCGKCGRRKGQLGKSVTPPSSSSSGERTESTGSGSYLSSAGDDGYSSGDSVSESTRESSETEYSESETDAPAGNRRVGRRTRPSAARRSEYVGSETNSTSPVGRKTRPSTAGRADGDGRMKRIKNKLAFIFHHHHHHHHHPGDENDKKNKKSAEKVIKNKEGHEFYVEQAAEGLGKSAGTAKLPRQRKGQQKQMNALVSGFVKHVRASSKSKKSKHGIGRPKAHGMQESKKLSWWQKRMMAADGAGKTRGRMKRHLLGAPRSSDS